jgi:hypothetical protein
VQPPFAHGNGSHFVTIMPLAQLPAPSQVCASTLVPLHTFAPHETPAIAKLAPVHDVRVFPSQIGAEHTLAPMGQGVRAPCGAPVMATHVPSDPIASHASHSPVQATLQQYPSTHDPLVHALAFAHAAPFNCFFAQTPLLQ